MHDESNCVLWVGRFGKAIADEISGRQPNCITAEALSTSVYELQGRIFILASWRPIISLCLDLDRIAHERSRPFLPVILEESILRVGPIVCPHRGPCWRCWLKRYQQHDPWPSRHFAVRKYYEEHEDDGPRGSFRPIVTIATGIVLMFIDAINRNCATPGLVWEFDFMARDIHTSLVIGVDDCHACGLRRSPATRSFEGIHQRLQELWRS